MAFELEVKNNILYMTLNTPGSIVNIFDHHAAVQVENAIQSLQSQPHIQAVVFKSSKRGSFINGVGLMLASAVHSEEDAIKLSEQVRRAYFSVRNAPVPTFALIQGNCYGCGLEFSLNCRFRVAQDTYDTHFYMTEIPEYLFIPTFGGTQHLPHAVGLENSIDLVLWGKKWTAPAAKRHGLIHQLSPSHLFDKEAEIFIKSKLNKGSTALPAKSKASQSQLVQKTESKIRSLPPAYHRVYLDCLDLMTKAAEKTKIRDTDYRLEVSRAARSIMDPISKSALSFFFTRQSVKGICLRDEQSPPPKLRFHFPLKTVHLREVIKLFKKRNLNEVEVLSSYPKLKSKSKEKPSNSPHHFVLWPAEKAVNRQLKKLGTGASNEQVSIILATLSRLGFEPPKSVPSGSLLLYSPFSLEAVPFFEIGLIDGPNDASRSLFSYLTQIGFHAVYSKPNHSFVLDRWLKAYLRPLVSYVFSGGSMEDLHTTLREFGFVKKPKDVLGQIKSKEWAKLLLSAQSIQTDLKWDDQSLINSLELLRQEPKSTFRIKRLLKKTHGKENQGTGKFHEPLIQALLVSFLAVAHRCLSEKSLRHPTFVDLIAREVFDFPLLHGSLCRHLSKIRVRDLLANQNEYEMYLTPQDFESAREFVKTGKGFYL